VHPRFVLVLLPILWVAGCGKPTPETTPAPSSTVATNVPPARSGAGGIVDALTGKTTIEAGLRTMRKVEEINSNEQKRLEEAMKP
jgi:hypothetical protein